jgi:Domain of unknown function (DUF4082)
MDSDIATHEFLITAGQYAVMKTSLMAIAAIPLVTAGPASFAQTVSLFTGQTPAETASSDTKAVTLGVKFWSTQAGTVSGIRFYRGAASSGGYTVRLYTASGSVLGQATLPNDTCTLPCWEEADFASPIPIAANTTYIAAYYTPVGRYAETNYGLTNSVMNGPLIASASSQVGGNGVYRYGSSIRFPQYTYEATNYYVDIIFTPTAPTLLLSINPPNPSIPSTAPAGTTVGTLNVTWSDGSPFTGTLSFSTPYGNDHGAFAIFGKNLIVNSGGGLGGDAGTTQHVTVTATQ